MADAQKSPGEMRVIDPRELNDLAAFAARGGLGQAVATQDCVAESPDQLMYITGDTLVLLRDLGEIVLASCEGVVGWIKAGDVKFSTVAGASSIKVPDTIVSSPTPPTRTVELPDVDNTPQAYTHSEGGLGSATWSQSSGGTPDARRAIGPFDLGTPQYSPEIPLVDSGYFEAQQQDGHTSGTEEGQGRVRSSVLSTASSEALGGIGGFMMGVGDESMDASGVEELADTPPITYGSATSTETLTRVSPSPPTSARLGPAMHTAASPTRSTLAEPVSPTSSKGGRPESSDSWDIYGDYARDSMYYKRSTRDLKAMSGMDQAFNLAKALADIPSPPPPVRPQVDTTLASATAPGPPVELDSISPRSRSRPKPLPLNLNLASPELERIRDSPVREERDQVRSPVEGETANGGSVATALRMRIQREREQGKTEAGIVTTVGQDDHESASPPAAPMVPPKSSSRLNAAIAETGTIDTMPLDGAEHTSGVSPTDVSDSRTGSPGLSAVNDTTDATEPVSAITPPTLFVTNAEEPEDNSHNGDAVDVGNESNVTEISAVSDSEQSTVIETPVDPPANEAVDIAVTPNAGSERPKQMESERTRSSPSPPLLASPIPLDVSTSTSPKLEPPANHPSPLQVGSPDLVAKLRAAQSTSPSLRQNLSPDLSLPGSPFSPSSPASPHSVTATRQAAAEIARSQSTPVQERNRVTTLLGRTEDLLGSKGPVPITFHMGSPGGFRSTGPSTMPLAGKEITHGLGLGLPSTTNKGRISPSAPGGGGPRRATSPLITSPLIDQPLSGIDDSRFPRSPVTARNTSSPVQTYTSTPPMPAAPVSTKDDISTSTASKSAKASSSTGSGLFPRARSRSFGATVAKAMGRGKKEKPPPPPLAINTALSPKSANVPLPPPANRKDGQDETDKKHRPATSASVPASPRVTGSAAPNSPRLPPSIPLSKTLTTQSTESLPSPRTTSAFTSASSVTLPRTPGSNGKTPKKPSKTLPSPVSHRDYAEETVKADGLDFELVQPKANLLLSPGSPSSTTTHTHESSHSPRLDGDVDSPRPGTINRSETYKSDLSASSARSLPLPETDEWGFIKDQSPTPEMFQSRSTASDHRAAEQKWLSIISTPLPAGTAIPKKVRKLALESGIPASLRGKVWGWMLAANGSKRLPGKYTELLSNKANLDPAVEAQVTSVFADHSVFAGPYSTGNADLRSVLIAFSRHTSSPLSPHVALMAGTLLIHCVAEDAFWLLDGLLGAGGIMREYFGEGAKGVQVDAAVFTGVLAGSEKVMSKKFKEMGLHPRSFLEKWYHSLFVRCLPWPTALRVIDALIAEGPRFLLIASLSILTLSRERIMALSSQDDVLTYLSELPQDALLLPEHFMKACAEVKFREEDYRRLKAGVEKEMGV